MAPTRRREIVGYCLFDFANSSYTTLIATVAFSRYFRDVVVGGTRGDVLWSVATAIALTILILTSPILGAVADHSGRKKRLLLVTTIQTVVACALLWFVGPGDVVLGVVLYVIGTIGFEGGYIFYNAFLPEVSTPKTIARVSAWSWGTGFIGGLIALVACAPFLARPLLDAGGAINPSAVADYRLSFVVVALFFALFSVPTFAFLRERGTRRSPAHWTGYARIGFRRVGETLAHLGRYRDPARYMLGTVFFYGGIDTVIKFSAIYATVTFGIDGRELILLFVATNIIAVPGTLIAGTIADRIGGKRALLGTLVMWLFLIVLGALSQSKTAFWIMAGGVAIGMGSTQSIARSLMAQLSPPERESEFFGFFILCSKIGSILSLLLFGAISAATGDQRLAVLSVAPFFLIGIVLVAGVREPRHQPPDA